MSKLESKSRSFLSNGQQSEREKKMFFVFQKNRKIPSTFPLCRQYCVYLGHITTNSSYRPLYPRCWSNNEQPVRPVSDMKFLTHTYFFTQDLCPSWPACFSNMAQLGYFWKRAILRTPCPPLTRCFMSPSGIEGINISVSIQTDPVISKMALKLCSLSCVSFLFFFWSLDKVQHICVCMCKQLSAVTTVHESQGTDTDALLRELQPAADSHPPKLSRCWR